MKTKIIAGDKAHSREDFIAYFDEKFENFEKQIREPGIKVERWGLETYYEATGKCMGCGCPPDNLNFKNSTSPYYCLICEKKMLGEEVYNKKQTKLNDWEDKTNGMTIKEKINLVKKSLIFG